MATEFKPVSLLERIKNAETTDKLISLIVEGSEYEHASPKTRGKWEKAAFARKRQLTAPVKADESQSKPRGKKDKKGVKK